MQIDRRLLLLFFLVLSACGTQDTEISPENFPPVENIAQDTGPLVFQLTALEVYITPDVEGRWTIVGPRLRSIEVPTSTIEIIVNPKDEENQPFEEALAEITASELEFGQEGDVLYAEGSNPIGARILYRDYPNAVLEFRLFDSMVDTFPDSILADWRAIALEGRYEVLN